MQLEMGLIERSGLFPIRRVVSRDRRNTDLQFIRLSLKSQRFSWPLIETQSDLVEVWPLSSPIPKENIG
jgi:hypothetical protein